MSSRVAMHLAATGLWVAALTGAAPAQPVPAQPVFTEHFAGNPGGPANLAERWIVSSRLDPQVQAQRVAALLDAGLGRFVGRISVQQGDALDGASPAEAAGRYVCDRSGSRAMELEANGGVVPSERAEMQIRHDRSTGAGELVRFGETTWYRFGFKIGGDWPRDTPAGDRPACRTVIHQIKQDSFRTGESCGASPFFKIEARPLAEAARFYAQIAWGASCASPPAVTRVPICVTDGLPRETWHLVNVRLLPAHRDGRADIWLNGRHCGSYRGPMADPEHGARRGGAPVINAQPRFGLYRDRRAETQTIYFDRIAFWNTDPSGHPDWDATGN